MDSESDCRCDPQMKHIYILVLRANVQFILMRAVVFEWLGHRTPTVVDQDFHASTTSKAEKASAAVYNVLN